uniref:Uncharacterized protein n=1 Tax=Helianthus annuus TaxID=4232 RepID=A0A251TXR6_HELAN
MAIDVCSLKLGLLMEIIESATSLLHRFIIDNQRQVWLWFTLGFGSKLALQNRCVRYD